MGAENFLILTVPDLGKTPESLAVGPADSAGASFLSSSLDTALTSGIPGLAVADSVHISVLDTSPCSTRLWRIRRVRFHQPTQPCLTEEVNYAGGTPCANPSQYLFWG
jgi:phospholipase/lecithinase/hemolysin